MLSEGDRPVASLSGDAEIVPNNHQGSKGESSLTIASENGNVNAVKSLSAQVSLQSMSPLIYASLLGNFEMVKFLLANKTQVNLRDTNGMSALIYATLYGDINIVRVLLENNAQVDLQDIDGMSSLMIASLNGHIDLVNLLLENKAYKITKERPL